jgi:ubiquinol-cytochrome c reductase subunit 8
MKQKGIVSYGIAPNRQHPLAGAAHDAIFNTWRRFSAQVLYWAPPMIAGYYLINWAVERCVVLAGFDSSPRRNPR